MKKYAPLFVEYHRAITESRRELQRLKISLQGDAWLAQQSMAAIQESRELLDLFPERPQSFVGAMRSTSVSGSANDPG
jgi:hypothetical protein